MQEAGGGEGEEGMRGLRGFVTAEEAALSPVERSQVNSLRMLTLAAHQVEVLLVLCAFCGGKQKERSQDRLAELGMVKALVKVFDRLDWLPPEPVVDPEPHGIHGPGCACNPQQAMKIQLLRLVHNFCDRDGSNFANKALLCTPDGGPPTGQAEPWLDPRASPFVGQGLMHKIVGVMMAEPADSVYRFWLASCVEAFLQGSDPRHQAYVAATGLMEYLVEEILKGGFKCAASLQIQFDLLGAIVKFNLDMFARLNGLISGDRFSRFIEVMVTHTMDSNVFIRSVMLSIECFKHGTPSAAAAQGGRGVAAPAAGPARFLPPGPSVYRTAPLNPTAPTGVKDPLVSPYWSRAGGGNGGATLGGAARGLPCLPGGSCPLIQFMICNALRILQDLMKAVKPTDMNQDNMCVLNTAVLFFVFAERQSQLATCLDALRASPPPGSWAAAGPSPATSPGGSAGPDPDILPSPSGGGRGGGVGFSDDCASGGECGELGPRGVLLHFAALLRFWQEYYAKRMAREAATLEFSSNIPFSEWNRCVDLLCGPAESPTSLRYDPQRAARARGGGGGGGGGGNDPRPPPVRGGAAAL